MNTGPVCAQIRQTKGRPLKKPGSPGDKKSGRARCRRRVGGSTGTLHDETDRIEDLLRELAPQVLGALMRKYEDLFAAEDAVQEALVAAAEQWPITGWPDYPRGWLIQVASRRMIDQLRNEQARRRREDTVVAQAPVTSAEPVDQDDSLVLLFMCCHPSLKPSAAVPLTLRAVGGLTTAEIATAFLIPEATMAQRISRAKQKIRSSGVPFRMPTGSDRLAQVLQVLYLIFNEGYTSTTGPELARVELSTEAIRLTRVLRRQLPERSRQEIGRGRGRRSEHDRPADLSPCTAGRHGCGSPEHARPAMHALRGGFR